MLKGFWLQWPPELWGWVLKLCAPAAQMESRSARDNPSVTASPCQPRLRCPKFFARIRSQNFDRCPSFLLASFAADGARKRPPLHKGALLVRTSLGPLCKWGWRAVGATEGGNLAAADNLKRAVRHTLSLF